LLSSLLLLVLASLLSLTFTNVLVVFCAVADVLTAVVVSGVPAVTGVSAIAALSAAGHVSSAAGVSNVSGAPAVIFGLVVVDVPVVVLYCENRCHRFDFKFSRLSRLSQQKTALSF
jgi:hypothetical protein